VQSVAQICAPVEANEHQIRDETLVAAHRFTESLYDRPPRVEWLRILCGLATKGSLASRTTGLGKQV
jgi:hypothetical protein